MGAFTVVKTLGIESTAHTFGVGMVKDEDIISNIHNMYIPKKGGIHPGEAADHHSKIAGEIVEKALIDTPDYIAYACCPGLGPCLRIGAVIAKYLAIKFKIPIIPVNHAEAHIDIGIKTTGAKDPVIVYVSGGNTQIIANHGGWKIFGETLDIAIGNAIDKLARELDMSHPGGPKLENLAKGGKFIEMPYTVKGMDLSYSGILTHAKNLLKTHSKKDVAYSFQEHIFSMLIEVSERAIAHTEKEEILLVGGVAKNSKLKNMFKIMCKDRGIKLKVVPDEFAGDNGAMIAYSGYLKAKQEFTITPERVNYFQRIRVDQDLRELFK